MQIHFYNIGKRQLIYMIIHSILSMYFKDEIGFWIFDSCCFQSLCELRPPRCSVSYRFTVCSPEPGRSGKSLCYTRGNLCWILMEHQVEKLMWKAESSTGPPSCLGFCFLLRVACLLVLRFLQKRIGDYVYFFKCQL